jgi:hypothetical protein
MTTSASNPACTPSKHGVVCTPGKDQNLFGRNTHGTLVLHVIAATTTSAARLLRP